jgi:aminopeptidase YwaD
MKRFCVAAMLAAAAGALVAQEREDRTLLSREQMTAIVNEASGEQAMHTLLELVPYQRVRPPDEYKGHFRESEVLAARAKAYGFSNVVIESFAEGQAWQPTQGELWMTSPRAVKLYDVHDVALSLASLNANMDATGDLVDVGFGRAADFEGKDLTGKFALMSEVPNGVGGANLRTLYTEAVSRGAIGAIGISVIGFERANDYPDQIVSTSAPASKPGTAAWAVSPKTARELGSMLARGDKVAIRSIVKSVEVPTRSEIVHAEIPGDGSTTQEVAIGGHLYEGVIKQGANDDNSGCALTLEIGRAYLKLIQEGKLPRPRRTINFQWLAEISGTREWLTRHPEKAKNIIGDLNFDMEGIRVGQSRSYWILQRTPDTFPSYINDVAQSMMEYVAEVSRERVRYRANGYGPVQPIVSARGSSDAFYIKVDKHYGASDHVTYMQFGIPAVMFITWPDMWYHSSEDTPDKQDSTQYKRAAVVGTGALAVLATGSDEIAARVLNENVGRGLSRMGESHVKGLGYLADAESAAGLAAAYREAVVAINHQAGVEKKVIESASILWTNVAAGKQKTSAFAPLIDQRAAALLNEVKAAYQLQAAQHGAAATLPSISAEEREAASLIVEVVQREAAGGRGGGRGGGAGAGGAGGGRGAGRGAGGPALPQEMSAEFNLLLPKRMTVLEIRDFLSGEFTPLKLADLMAVLRAREAAGSIRLVPKP